LDLQGSRGEDDSPRQHQGGPVYAPLAEQVVTEFGLEDKEGLGIDLGGGSGNLSLKLCKLTKKMRWINTDINPYFFDYFCQKAQEAGLRESGGGKGGCPQELPFEDNFADIIVSRGSYKFWGDKKKAFSEIYRVLKPGGMAYIGRGFPGNLPVETARRTNRPVPPSNER